MSRSKHARAARRKRQHEQGQTRPEPAATGAFPEEPEAAAAGVMPESPEPAEAGAFPEEPEAAGRRREAPGPVPEMDTLPEEAVPAPHSAAAAAAVRFAKSSDLPAVEADVSGRAPEGPAPESARIRKPEPARGNEAAPRVGAELPGISPGTADGRNVDPGLGTLEGEAAGMRVSHPERAYPYAYTLRTIPSESGPSQEPPTYYGLPVVKRDPWRWMIPTYFFLGGMAGASAALGAGVQTVDRRRHHDLIGHCRKMAAAASVASGALLIADLGRPARFHFMLRVFRPTSPMNIGTWILTAAGGPGTAAVLFHKRGDIFGRFADASALISGAAGIPLAGYTAVLLANSSVPVWQAARGSLPVLFMGSAVSSAAAMLEMLPLRKADTRIVRTYGAVGAAAELAASIAVERAAARAPEVAQPFRSGRSGFLWRAAQVLAAAGFVLSLIPGRSRTRRIVAGALGAAAAGTLRFAVVEAGRQSAMNPRAVSDQERIESEVERGGPDHDRFAPEHAPAETRQLGRRRSRQEENRPREEAPAHRTVGT